MSFKKCAKLGEWKWGPKIRTEETTFGSPEFAVGTQWDLKLNLGFRDGQNASSHLGSGGVGVNTSGELQSDIKD